MAHFCWCFPITEIFLPQFFECENLAPFPASTLSCGGTHRWYLKRGLHLKNRYRTCRMKNLQFRTNVLIQKSIIWKYFSKLLLKILYNIQAYKRPCPFRSTPSICNQRSLDKCINPKINYLPVSSFRLFRYVFICIFTNQILAIRVRKQYNSHIHFFFACLGYIVCTYFLLLLNKGIRSLALAVL